MRYAAAATPSAAAMSSGLSTMPDTTSNSARPMLVRTEPLNAISSGTRAKISSASNEKISATGTAASWPSVASASPGPM